MAVLSTTGSSPRAAYINGQAGAYGGAGATAPAPKADFVKNLAGISIAPGGGLTPGSNLSTGARAAMYGPGGQPTPAAPQGPAAASPTPPATATAQPNASAGAMPPTNNPNDASYGLAGQPAPAAPAAPENPPPGAGAPPAAPAAPAGNPLAGYSSAAKAYIDSLQPDGSVTAARTYLNGLITSAARDQETALNSGETLGFAGGEAGRVNRNNQISVDAASRAYEALTGAQSQAQTASKARLDYMSGLLKPETLSAGQTAFRINPTTGQYEQVGTGGSLADKNALDTFFNLQQTYPDASIRWDPSRSAQDNLQAAQSAAEQSPTYQSKSTTIRSVQLPGGGLGFYNSKDGNVYDQSGSVIGKIGSGGNITTAISSEQGAADKADAASLKTQQVYADSTQRAFNTANANLQQLVGYMQTAGINTGSNVPLVNDLENRAKAGLIDPGSVSAFRAAIAGLRAEYAQVLSRGGEVTEGQRAQANSLIPDNLTPQQLQQVTDRLKVEGTNAIKEATDQVKTIQDRMSGRSSSSSSSSSSGDSVGWF